MLKEEEQWIGITKAAAHLSVSRETMYRWIKEKDLPCHQVGNLFRFKVSELDQWARVRQPKRSPKRKLNLLLVEDDPSDVVVAKKILESKNFNITLVKDGEAALEILENTTPEIIFLDLHLPLLDGVSVLKEIKKQSHLSDIPVVCITGFDKYLKKILELSPITVLSKPLTEEKINQALKLTLQNLSRVNK